MIVDHRTYSFHPGKLPAWLQLYEEKGLPIQSRHLGWLVGFFVTEVGPLNQVVFMWAYDSMADREIRRAKMEADSEWTVFKKESGHLGALKSQENKILAPTSFSPLK